MILLEGDIVAVRTCVFDDERTVLISEGCDDFILKLADCIDCDSVPEAIRRYRG